jgi:hypothetical protein
LIPVVGNPPCRPAATWHDGAGEVSTLSAEYAALLPNCDTVNTLTISLRAGPPAEAVEGTLLTLQT